MKNNTAVTSLQTIKQKFLTTKDELILPWQQYASSPSQQQHNNTDYDDLMQEITKSHAFLAATYFQTLSFEEADKIQTKYQQLKEMINSLYERIRVNTDTTRATIMSLKLDLPQSNYEFYQLIQYTSQIEQLLEEFYFTSKYANHLESKYLQHIAGSLCSNNNNRIEYYYDRNSGSNNDDVLSDILSKLKIIIYEQQQQEEENDDEDEHTPLSLLSSSPCSSFSSTTSSLTSKIFSSKSSSTNTSVTTIDSPTTTTIRIQQQINTIIDKLSRRLKQKEQVIRLFEIQAKNIDTQEELARQRERSANLVLELEKSRSLRLLSSKEKDEEITALKDQNQSFQVRITALEHALKKKDKMIENSSLEIETLRSKLRESQQFMQKLTSVSSQAVNNNNNGDNSVEEGLKQLVKQFKDNESLLNKQKIELKEKYDKILELENEKMIWINTKKSIFNQFNIREEEEQLLLKERQKAVTDEKEQQKQNKVYQALLETIIKNDTLLKSKQSEITQLKEAIKTLTMRESAYILQSASTEVELERILKEYDRLTRNIIDFNKERKKFELEIRELIKEKIEISKQLSDEQIRNIHSYNHDGTLRREFRDLMATVKEKHQFDLLKELDTRRKIEQELREKMSEIEMKRWEKVDIGIQTFFVVSE
jgi:hypothetical protein